MNHTPTKEAAIKKKTLSIRSGQLMIACCVLALVLANSPFSEIYQGFNQTKIAFHVGSFSIAKPFIIWMNEGLMAVFFFFVGLEIRHAIEDGPLGDWKKIALPVYGAIGGMVIPGLIYLIINFGNAEYLSGWAIPVATDIAFSLAVLAMVTPGLDASLRIFLSTLAIIDDIGAILIIALFYTNHFSLYWFILATLCIFTMVLLKYLNVRRLGFYMMLTLLLWYALIYSGFHATLAGVLLAMLLPSQDEAGKSMIPGLMDSLEPWVNFCILPLFALMNSGVVISFMSMDFLQHPVLLGSLLGLVIGKPVGVMLFTSGSIFLGKAEMPKEVTWSELLGVSCLTGIGFTMSLFIGSLAFESLPELLSYAKIGVLVGSLVSGCLGAYFLYSKRKGVVCH